MPTLPDIAAAVGIHLDLKLVSRGEKGPELQGPCPTPGCGGEDRFHVWPEKDSDRGGSFWCRKCGAAGDGIFFLRNFGSKLSFREACRVVGKELDDRKSGATATGSRRRPWKSTPIPPKMPLDGGKAKTGFLPRECPLPGEKWRNQALKYVLDGKAALLNNPAALAKLQRERGLTAATIDRFNLGLLLPREGGKLRCRFSSRKLWGLEPKEGAKKPASLWLPRGLIIPCCSGSFSASGTANAPGNAENASGNAENAAENGNICNFIRLRIRRHPDDLKNGVSSKYYVVPGSSTQPLLLLESQPAVVVVESELDALIIHQQVGALVGVLALGSCSARPDHAAAARLQNTPLLLLAFDNDAAGAKAAATWSNWYDHCARLTLPDGIKDPGEYHQSGGDLAAWISAALPSPWRLPPPQPDVRGPEQPEQQQQQQPEQPDHPGLAPQDPQNERPPFPPDDPFQALYPPESGNNELSAPDFTPPPPFDYPEPPPPAVNIPEPEQQPEQQPEPVLDGRNYKPLPDLEFMTF